MKKQILPFLVFFVVFCFFLSSCIDHDYDLEDEKIDTKMLLSPDGINFPFGNIDRILIFDKLNYDAINVAGDGSLYVEYEGNLDPGQLKIPNYSIAPIGQVSTNDKSIQLPPGISGDFDFSSLPINALMLLEGEKVDYEFSNPVSDIPDWTIEPSIIYFDAFGIELNFSLQGFTRVSGSATLKLYIYIPECFEVDEALGANRIITRSVKFNENNSSQYILQRINLKSFSYPANGYASIRYDLKVEEMNSFVGRLGNDPSFKLTLATDNNNITINSIKGKVKGKQLIKGEIDDFKEFKNSFGENSKFQFENPSLFLKVNTNLGATFRFDIDKIEANGNSVSLKDDKGLLFEKPSNPNTQKETSYYIAPDPNKNAPAGAIRREMPLNNLFATVPDKANYEFSININDDDATLIKNGIVLQGGYKFSLPFNFNDLKINIKIPPLYLGENIYDDLLKYVREKITIQADTVIISVEKISQLKLTAAFRFLDSDQEVVKSVAAKSVSLSNGLNKDKLVIDFSKQDFEKLENENAQYLEIEFSLEGNGALSNKDYIDIRGLRFKSDGGILYNYNL